MRAGRIPADHAAHVVIVTGHGVVVGVRAVPAGAVAAVVQDGEAGRDGGVELLAVGLIAFLPPHQQLVSVVRILLAGSVELGDAVRH